MADDRPARVADLVARTLHDHGVRFAFGMPGGEVVTLLDAMDQAGIHFTLARHETAAAIMAAGSYRASGRPGVVLTTLGPGLANAVNGIADAWQERVPLIVLSGVCEHGLRSRYTHQIVDHAALLRPLVKASFEIEPEGAAATVARALRLTTERPFGPVHLDLSPATAAAMGPVGSTAVASARRITSACDPGAAAITEARTLIAEARCPVVIAGLDAAEQAVCQPLRTLVERLGAPLVTTYRAKGVIDEHHPLAIGGAGLSPLADRSLLPLIQAADLVLLVGYDPIEMRPGWLDAFPPSTKVIELTPGIVEHGMHRADLTIIGALPDLLTALKAGLPEGLRTDRTDVGRVRADLDLAFAMPPGRFGPHQVVDVLQSVLDADTTVTVDSGAHRILLSQKLRLFRPLQLLQSSGWCTMGAALPLAIGFKRAAPEQHLIAVMGDGGLEMVAGELATLRDLLMPMTVLVLQDQSLALIALKQSQAGLPSSGVTLPCSDFTKLAEAFGGQGRVAANAVDLARYLREAKNGTTFTLIACSIDAVDYVGRI